MSKEFSEENIAQFKKYLNNELSFEERILFYKRMQEEPTFKENLEQYELIQEGIDRYKVAKAAGKYDSIAQKETAKEKIVPATPVVPMPRKQSIWRRVLSHAAILAMGLWIGQSIIPAELTPEPLLVDNVTITEMKFGGKYDKLPSTYSSSTTILKIHITNDAVSTDSSKIDVFIKQVNQPIFEFSINHEANYMQFILNDADTSLALRSNANVKLILEKIGPSKQHISLLAINDNIIPIKLSNEDFQKLFK